jgi:endonuclease/exonuclease/phosphatase (EEP) superfamily protein YafD
MKKYLPIGVFVSIYSILILLSLYLQGYMVFDLIGFLLPYWIALSLIMFSGLFILYLKITSRSGKRILFGSLCMLFAVTLLMIFQFYTFSYVTLPSGSGKIPLQVAFLNKLYSNTNYEDLNKKIDQNNPDIIGFSEMKNIDRSNIPALENYPYWFSKNSRDGATISFYSKYPAETDNGAMNLQFVLPVVVEVSGSKYHVFVTHPFPPASNSWVRERNSDLNAMATYINTLPSGEQKNVLVLGDFNLSPWSRTYQTLAANMPFIKDTERGAGMQFSWHGQFIQTEIDHIFVPASSKIESFQSIYVPGSDHNMLFAKLAI